MEKKKIIFLVNSGDFSGAEKVNLEIIQGLREKYEFYYASERGTIDEYLSELQIEHIVVPKIGRKEVREIEKKYHPALFHATDYHVSVICALAGIKTPFLSHVHNNCPWLKHLHPYSFAFLYAGYKARKILTVSSTIEKEYIFSRYVRKKMIYLPNSVSVREIRRKKGEMAGKKYDICFVGRLTEQKNPLFLLEIIEGLQKKHQKISAVLVGDGQMRERVEERIREKKLSGCVELVGFQKNPYHYMQQSKIFCLPSNWEGYPMVILEALALGLPCYASPVGGLVNVITDECGALCGTKEEFCGKIESVLQNPEEYERKSHYARKRAEELDNMEEYIHKIEGIYVDAI